MSSHANDEKNSKSSSSKTFGIIILLIILGIVAYKFSKSPEESSSDKIVIPTQKIEKELPEIPKNDVEEIASNDTPKTYSEESLTNTDKNDEPITTTPDTPAKITNTEQDIKEINQFLEDWKSAWQKSAGPNGNLDTYFMLYTDNFSPGKLSSSQWKNSKRIRNQGKSWIEVWISDIVITKQSDESYSITFKQEYSSSNYSDKGSKMLIVKKETSTWQIVNEKGL